MTEQTGLHWKPVPADGAKTGPAALLSLLFVSAGLCMTAGALFPSLPVPWWALFLAAAGVHLLLLALPGRKNWLFPAGCGVLLALCLLFYRPLVKSAGWGLNDLLTALTALTGRIYLHFETGGSPLWAFAAAAAFLVLLHHQAVSGGGRWLFLPAVLLGSAGLVLGSRTPGLLLIVLGAVMSLPSGGWKAQTGRLCAACLCAAAALGLGAAARALPLASWRGSLTRDIHALRYDSAALSMPEGQLSSLGAWEKSETPALTVTMSQPEATYLRGSVYEVYTGGSWEKRENEDRASSSDLYYWLHENGFYGQSQIASAAAAAGIEERQQITVENVGACRGHGFLPYGSETVGDARAIGDDALPSAAAQTCLPGGLAQWYGVQRALADRQSEERDYLSLERAYAADVTEADLQLTDEAWQVLGRQLGTDTGSRTLSQIQTTIRTYLSDHLRYDESVYTPLGGDDFLHYVLERSGAGYSVHYATAAVLMLRYYGVPARYVEGYYLTPEQAAAAKAGETVTLTEENAHAWAEFYLNGVGFVPFEVTPGYIREEDLDFGSDQTGPGQTVYTAQPRQYAPQDGQTPQDQPPQATTLRLPRQLWLLAVLVLLALLAVPVIRRCRFRRARKRMAAAPCRAAIVEMYGYACYLMGFLGEIPAEAAQSAAALNREASFSDHPMTDDQRQEMDDFVRDLTDRCGKQWNPLQRIYYRWIRCVY